MSHRGIEVRLYTEGHDIVVCLLINGTWRELIRTHGAIRENTVSHHAGEGALGLTDEEMANHCDAMLCHYAAQTEEMRARLSVSQLMRCRPIAMTAGEAWLLDVYMHEARDEARGTLTERVFSKLREILRRAWP